MNKKVRERGVTVMTGNDHAALLPSESPENGPQRRYLN